MKKLNPMTTTDLTAGRHSTRIGVAFETDGWFGGDFEFAAGAFGAGSYPDQDRTSGDAGQVFQKAFPWGVRHAQSLAEFIFVARSGDQPVVFDGEFEREDLDQIAAGLWPEWAPTQPIQWNWEIGESTTPGSVAWNWSAQPLRTDGAAERFPPTITLFHFNQADSTGGGEFFFASVEDVVAGLDEDTIWALCEGRFCFAARGQDGAFDHFEGPLLSRDDRGRWLLRWHSDEAVTPEAISEAECFRTALKALGERMESVPTTAFAPQTGQIFAFNNGFSLRGRGPMFPHSRQVVLRTSLP